MKCCTAMLIAAGLAFGTLAGAQAAEETRAATEDQAFVRFVHASPNAELSQVLLANTEQDAGGVAVEGFPAITYPDTTEYVAIPAGRYDVMVTLEGIDGADVARAVPAETLDAAAGHFYTIALMGLAIPEDFERAEAAEEEEGFLAWLRDLFTADGPDRSLLGLRLMVLDDEAVAEIAEDETRVRIVHAAPGTDTVELVVDPAGDAIVQVVDTVSYGDVSGFATIDREQGALAVRIEGAETAIIDFAERDLQSGMIHTIFVTGTPIEDVPLEAMVLATEPVAREEAAATREDDPAAGRVAEPAEPADPAVAPDVREPPDDADIAWVRFVHAAPNAETEQVMMTSQDAARGITIEEFVGVDYKETTDYVAIPAGAYDIVVSLTGVQQEAGVTQLTPVETLNARGNQFYTIALVGLVIPEDWERAEARDEGFLGWLRGLFTDDGADRDVLGLRVMVLEDDITAFGADPGQETHIRIVHAAPGTESVELVLNRTTAADAEARRDGADVVERVGYGDASRFSTVDTTHGTLEVRIEGSQLVVIDLADFQLAPGMMHTIFFTGTPVEDVPLDAMVVSTAALAPEEAEPRQPAD